MSNKFISRQFTFRIILPTLFVFALFTVLIFAVILPSIKGYMIDGKREMIRELTNSAWSVVEEYDREVQDSTLTLADARQLAILRIENMRYGEEGKDYFWITDLYPKMIMHPYRSELNNTDLTNYMDPTGKRLFVESVRVVEASGEGYIDYQWQWKDDSSRIVPKLSFVKAYRNWGWVIGTGIYLEDIQAEIADLTGNLVYGSLGLLFVIGFSLFFIGRQSLLIESRRQQAEILLRESESKYRALVDASTDGLVVLLDGTYIYANKALELMLGYSSEEVANAGLGALLIGRQTPENTGGAYFAALARGATPASQTTAKLWRKDNSALEAVLYASDITLGQKSGYTIIVKDVSAHKQVEAALDQSREKYQVLANSLKMGIFTFRDDPRGKILEVNEITTSLLGYYSKEAMVDLPFRDLFFAAEDYEQCLRGLHQNGSIANHKVTLKKKDGGTIIVTLSAAVSQTAGADPKTVEGTLHDITAAARMERNRDDLIVELQTSLRFLYQPVGQFTGHFSTCTTDTSIRDAARRMGRNNATAVLVKTRQDEFVGIVTEHDLQQRVVAENIDPERPVFEFVSSPLQTISAAALVFEAIIQMRQAGIRHLAVKDSKNAITGIITSEHFIALQNHSASYLLAEIEQADAPEALAALREKVQLLVKVFADSGAASQIITHIITSVFNAIAEKFIGFAIAELGPPPAAFAFVALGSVGRVEQTLTSDQDNAIIYEDVSPDMADSVHRYFHQLGTKVCDWLNDCGYVYCPGEAMAKNPKWCQSLSTWQGYFHDWMANSDQQDLIDISIFFDFRSIYGKAELTERLRSQLFKDAEGQAGFFQHLTRNSLLHKPPVSLMGKIRLASRGEHPETFDIKSALMPITDFARIYALKNGIRATNTLQRLEALLDKGIINRATLAELQQAYNTLMQLRFRHQLELLMQQQPADNHINPAELTQIEEKNLRAVFAQVASIQKKMGYDFSGEAI
jgi:PAS domain S-box-containing protein